MLINFKIWRICLYIKVFFKIFLYVKINFISREFVKWDYNDEESKLKIIEFMWVEVSE